MDKWTKGEIVKPDENTEKPSKLWMIYHFWCGMSLYVFVDVSGLLNFIVNNFAGLGSGAATSTALIVSALSVGVLVLGYYLSQSLVEKIVNSKMSTNGKIALKTAFPILCYPLAIFLAMVTMPILKNLDENQISYPPITMKAEKKPVLVATTSQSTAGITEEQFDQVFLNNLEDWLIKTILEKGINKYPDGFSPEINSSSTYITLMGMKLAVIKINVANYTRMVAIIGIKGGQLHRVNCIRASNHDIPIWSGECGNEIQKIFGVRLQLK
ncbi:MAG: hypothetical protein GTO02_13785 [Candidatus Dadabacteria bacterium]|nr:hypothetical protein [Candidatus Dadabacteria bacterium]